MKKLFGKRLNKLTKRELKIISKLILKKRKFKNESSAATPQWWQKMSKDARKNYIKRNPGSSLKNKIHAPTTSSKRDMGGGTSINNKSNISNRSSKGSAPRNKPATPPSQGFLNRIKNNPKLMKAAKVALGLGAAGTAGYLGYKHRDTLGKGLSDANQYLLNKMPENVYQKKRVPENIKEGAENLQERLKPVLKILQDRATSYFTPSEKEDSNSVEIVTANLKDKIDYLLECSNQNTNFNRYQNRGNQRVNINNKHSTQFNNLKNNLKNLFGKGNKPQPNVNTNKNVPVHAFHKVRTANMFK